MLDFAICNAARLRRDAHYDGVFFIGVKTTKIYCRPVCRVKQPQTRNIQFYATAAAAEAAGFRPCLRCRPEAAPFCPAWNGTRTTVARALRLIDEGELDHSDIESFAMRLGVTPRHLNRLFRQHLDTTPTQVAKTRRVQRAKMLLENNELSISVIARMAGFSHARRMNAAFNALYGRPPSAFRCGRQKDTLRRSAAANNTSLNSEK